MYQIIKRIDTREQRRQNLRLIEIDGPAGDAGQIELLQSVGMARRRQHRISPRA